MSALDEQEWLARELRKRVAFAVLKSLHASRIQPLWLRVLKGKAFRSRETAWPEDCLAAGDAAIQAVAEFGEWARTRHDYLEAYASATEDPA